MQPKNVVFALFAVFLAVSLTTGSGAYTDLNKELAKVFGLITGAAVSSPPEASLFSQGLNSEAYELVFDSSSIPNDYELLIQFREQGTSEWRNFGNSFKPERFVQGNSLKVVIKPVWFIKEPGVYEFRIISAPFAPSSDAFFVESKPYIQLAFKPVMCGVPVLSCGTLAANGIKMIWAGSDADIYQLEWCPEGSEFGSRECGFTTADDTEAYVLGFPDGSYNFRVRAEASDECSAPGSWSPIRTCELIHNPPAGEVSIDPVAVLVKSTIEDNKAVQQVVFKLEVFAHSDAGMSEISIPMSLDFLSAPGEVLLEPQGMVKQCSSDSCSAVWDVSIRKEKATAEEFIGFMNGFSGFPIEIIDVFGKKTVLYTPEIEVLRESCFPEHRINEEFMQCVGRDEFEFTCEPSGQYSQGSQCRDSVNCGGENDCKAVAKATQTLANKKYNLCNDVCMLSDDCGARAGTYSAAICPRQQIGYGAAQQVCCLLTKVETSPSTINFLDFMIAAQEQALESLELGWFDSLNLYKHVRNDESFYRNIPIDVMSLQSLRADAEKGLLIKDTISTYRAFLGSGSKISPAGEEFLDKKYSNAWLDFLKECESPSLGADTSFTKLCKDNEFRNQAENRLKNVRQLEEETIRRTATDPFYDALSRYDSLTRSGAGTGSVEAELIHLLAKKLEDAGKKDEAIEYYAVLEEQYPSYAKIAEVRDRKAKLESFGYEAWVFVGALGSEFASLDNLIPGPSPGKVKLLKFLAKIPGIERLVQKTGVGKVADFMVRQGIKREKAFRAVELLEKMKAKSIGHKEEKELGEIFAEAGLGEVSAAGKKLVVSKAVSPITKETVYSLLGPDGKAKKVVLSASEELSIKSFGVEGENGIAKINAFWGMLLKSDKIESSAALRYNVLVILDFGVSEEAIIDVFENGASASKKALDEVFAKYIKPSSETGTILSSDLFSDYFRQFEAGKLISDAARAMESVGLSRDSIRSVMRDSNGFDDFARWGRQGYEELYGNMAVLFPEILSDDELARLLQEIMRLKARYVSGALEPEELKIVENEVAALEKRYFGIKRFKPVGGSSINIDTAALFKRANSRLGLKENVFDDLVSLGFSLEDLEEAVRYLEKSKLTKFFAVFDAAYTELDDVNRRLLKADFMAALVFVSKVPKGEKINPNDFIFNAYFNSIDRTKGLYFSSTEKDVVLFGGVQTDEVELKSFIFADLPDSERMASIRRFVSYLDRTKKIDEISSIIANKVRLYDTPSEKLDYLVDSGVSAKELVDLKDYLHEKIALEEFKKLLEWYRTPFSQDVLNRFYGLWPPIGSLNSRTMREMSIYGFAEEQLPRGAPYLKDSFVYKKLYEELVSALPREDREAAKSVKKIIDGMFGEAYISAHDGGLLNLVFLKWMRDQSQSSEYLPYFEEDILFYTGPERGKVMVSRLYSSLEKFAHIFRKSVEQLSSSQEIDKISKVISVSGLNTIDTLKIASFSESEPWDLLFNDEFFKAVEDVPVDQRGALTRSIIPLLHLTGTYTYALQRGSEGILLVQKNSEGILLVQELAVRLAKGSFEEWRYSNDVAKVQLNALSPSARKAWQDGSETMFKGLRAFDTDDPDVMIRLGECPVITCQFWGGGSYSDSLLAYVLDANKKAILVEDKDGRLLGRALLRVVSVNDRPALMLEPLYSSVGPQDASINDLVTAVFEHAVKKADELDAWLLAKDDKTQWGAAAGRTEKGVERLDSVVVQLQPNHLGYEYIDSLMGMTVTKEPLEKEIMDVIMVPPSEGKGIGAFIPKITGKLLGSVK